MKKPEGKARSVVRARGLSVSVPFALDCPKQEPSWSALLVVFTRGGFL